MHAHIIITEALVEAEAPEGIKGFNIQFYIEGKNGECLQLAEEGMKTVQQDFIGEIGKALISAYVNKVGE